MIALHVEKAGLGIHEVEGVSLYATMSPHEFFAEVFAQRNSPEGWAPLDEQTRDGLERFAPSINGAGRRVL